MVVPSNDRLADVTPMLRVGAEIAKLMIEKLPELHWDKLPQVFPHWEDCIPEDQKFKD